MIAYKFLRPGGIGPFSGYRWSVPVDAAPGPWVEAAEHGRICRDGIHACNPDALPLWIWEELWEVELDGRIDVRPHKLRAQRGRLARRIEAWSPTTATAFARASAARAAAAAAEILRANGHEEAAAAFEAGADLEAVRAHTDELWGSLPADARVPVGMASDGALRALTASASSDPYVAANGAAVTGYIAAMTAMRVFGREAYDRERGTQAEWLQTELGL